MNGFQHRHLWVWADEVCPTCGRLTCKWICISCQMSDLRCQVMGDDEVDG